MCPVWSVTYVGGPYPPDPPSSFERGLNNRPGVWGLGRKGRAYTPARPRLIPPNLFFAFLAAIPAPAHAHPVAGEAIGLVSGFTHPLSGLDHIVAMVSVGLWGAQLGAPAIWLLPVTFPLVMAVGGFLGLVGVPLPGTELGIALSGLALGIAVMASWRPKLWVAAVLVGAFGLFHGHAHGAELPPGQDALMYSAGFVAATELLHLTGIAIGLVHRWPWGRVLLRGAGAAVAVCGCYFLREALA
jgi:urease accessory protein